MQVSKKTVSQQPTRVSKLKSKKAKLVADAMRTMPSGWLIWIAMAGALAGWNTNHNSKFVR